MQSNGCVDRYVQFLDMNPGRHVSTTAHQIPPQLQGLLLEFTVNVLIEQPSDLLDYAASYFNKQLATRTEDHTSHHTNSLPHGSSAIVAVNSDESLELSDEEEEYVPDPSVNKYNRRKSVFAEHYDPEADDDDDSQKVIFPKSDEQRKRLSEAVKGIFLFRSLDQEQMQDVLNAMFECKVGVDDYVIKQGDGGDNFYIIESGIYNIFVTCHNAEKYVGKYEDSGSFGELALMYNMPRAATIKAQTPGSLWAMDRPTFRRILLKNAFKKRRMYETLLESVPMLKTLEPYERMNLADALVPKLFEDRDEIIHQGHAADGMYFVEDGTVQISMIGEDGTERELSRVTKGGYFGELALVTHKPRAASAMAVGKVRLAFLDVQAFERLLGPCMEIMKRSIEDYEEQLIKIFGSQTNLSDAR
uniref:cAMP-dependent protein kinase type II regulatory subunit n=1 Tax=Strigamia maritima TaxID=126957 RepID=T1IS03_STRMM